MVRGGVKVVGQGRGGVKPRSGVKGGGGVKVVGQGRGGVKPRFGVKGGAGVKVGVKVGVG